MNLDSGEKLNLPDGSVIEVANTLNLYYRKRRALLWLYSKECNSKLTDEEREIRNYCEKYSLYANIGLKVVGLMMLVNVRPYKSIMTKSLQAIVLDVIFAYYGFYAWIMSNVAPYGYMFEKYKPLVTKCHKAGIKIGEVPGYDLTQMDVNKCKFYTYDPIF